MADEHEQMGRLQDELGRAYRALRSLYSFAVKGEQSDTVALAYHSMTIAAAVRFVDDGSLDGAAYFESKPVDVLHATLAKAAPQRREPNADALYIERSRVCEILTRVEDEHVHIAEGLLADIDQLPIITASELRQAPGEGDALEALVAASERAYGINGDDDEDVAGPGIGITFGMIKRARAALSRPHPVSPASDLQEAEQIVRELHGLKGFEAWAARIAKALAVRSAPASGVPEGWRLVPEEPTAEMIRATYPDSEGTTRANWHNMLSASPPPPQGRAPREISSDDMIVIMGALYGSSSDYEQALYRRLMAKGFHRSPANMSGAVVASQPHPADNVREALVQAESALKAAIEDGLIEDEHGTLMGEISAALHSPAQSDGIAARESSAALCEGEAATLDAKIPGKQGGGIRQVQIASALRLAAEHIRSGHSPAQSGKEERS